MPAPPWRLAIINAIYTLEAAEQKNGTESEPNQSRKFLSYEVFRRPDLCLPSILPSTTSSKRRWFK